MPDIIWDTSVRLSARRKISRDSRVWLGNNFLLQCWTTFWQFFLLIVKAVRLVWWDAANSTDPIMIVISPSAVVTPAKAWAIWALSRMCHFACCFLLLSYCWVRIGMGVNWARLFLNVFINAECKLKTNLLLQLTIFEHFLKCNFYYQMCVFAFTRYSIKVALGVVIVMLFHMLEAHEATSMECVKTVCKSLFPFHNSFLQCILLKVAIPSQSSVLKLKRVQ